MKVIRKKTEKATTKFLPHNNSVIVTINLYYMFMSSLTILRI